MANAFDRCDFKCPGSLALFLKHIYFALKVHRIMKKENGKRSGTGKNELHFGALENVRESFFFFAKTLCATLPRQTAAYHHILPRLLYSPFVRFYIKLALGVGCCRRSCRLLTSPPVLPLDSTCLLLQVSNKIILYLFYTWSTRMRYAPRITHYERNSSKKQTSVTIHTSAAFPAGVCIVFLLFFCVCLLFLSLAQFSPLVFCVLVCSVLCAFNAQNE